MSSWRLLIGARCPRLRPIAPLVVTAYIRMPSGGPSPDGSKQRVAPDPGALRLPRREFSKSTFPTYNCAMNGPAASRTSTAPARRGLATVAFLKARFDTGVDHLGLFQPFIEDAVLQSATDAIELSAVQTEVRASLGLNVPTDIIRTLLKRTKNKGLLTRRGGRYLRTHGYNAAAFGTQMRRFELATARLAARLRQYAATRGQNFASDDDALAALTHFLDAHHIGVVLGQPIRVGSADTSAGTSHTVAAFVAEILAESGADSTVLDSIVKGFIVQNALLLRDVPVAGRHLSALSVYLDTGVLLRALGYAGSIERLAATEALALLRSAGARLRTFEGTVEEIKTILHVYEQKLGTSTGIKELRSTPLTHHFLTSKTTPAEVRQETVLLNRNLQVLGVAVRPFPVHTHDYTENEAALAEVLRDPNKTDADARVWHDVMAIAGIMTLRAGTRPNRMSDAQYVFASGSVLTVANASHWYRRSYSHGLEPIVHFRSVTNAAWVVRPADASDVPMHQLVAVCAAVLQPSVEIWSRFVTHLDELVASGELSDDESIAVVASEFTRVQLADLEVDDDIEATTVREIVERVRADEHTQFASQLDDERRKREASEKAIVAARSELAAIKGRARNRADQLAAWGARGIYGVFLGILGVGALWTLPTNWSEATRQDAFWGIVWWVCVLFFVVASILACTARFHTLNLYRYLKRSLAEWLLQRVLLPESRRRRDRIFDV